MFYWLILTHYLYIIHIVLLLLQLLHIICLYSISDLLFYSQRRNTKQEAERFLSLSIIDHDISLILEASLLDRSVGRNMTACRWDFYLLCYNHNCVIKNLDIVWLNLHSHAMYDYGQLLEEWSNFKGPGNLNTGLWIAMKSFKTSFCTTQKPANVVFWVYLITTLVRSRVT